MNNIDDILERLKGQQPVMSNPDELTEHIMESLPDIGENKAQVVSIRRWLSIAACLLVVLGVGTMLLFNANPTQPEVAQLPEKVVPIIDTDSTNHQYSQYQSSIQPVSTTDTKRTKHRCKTDTADKPSAPMPSVSESSRPVEENDPNLHYATHELTKDTLPYQDPARVDGFITKLAEYNNVKQGELTCSAPLDSNVVSAVYVFPDKKEIDVFKRLLQVACWYSDETPGYHLNFSHRQFFFELKDMRKQLQYRWIAERVNGKILLYSTCAPIEVVVSSACYQEYRDELMHIKSIHSKPKEI